MSNDNALKNKPVTQQVRAILAAFGPIHKDVVALKLGVKPQEVMNGLYAYGKQGPDRLWRLHEKPRVDSSATHRERIQALLEKSPPLRMSEIREKSGLTNNQISSVLVRHFTKTADKRWTVKHKENSMTTPSQEANGEAKKDNRCFLNRATGFKLMKWLEAEWEGIEKSQETPESAAARASAAVNHQVSHGQMRALAKAMEKEWPKKPISARKGRSRQGYRNQRNANVRVPLLAKQVCAVVEELRRVFTMLEEKFDPENTINMKALYALRDRKEVLGFIEGTSSVVVSTDNRE